MQTFRVLSALLCYPEPPMRDALETFAPVLEAEGALPADVRAGLDRFITYLGADDLLDAQEHYVALFDQVQLFLEDGIAPLAD